MSKHSDADRLAIDQLEGRIVFGPVCLACDTSGESDVRRHIVTGLDQMRSDGPPGTLSPGVLR